jgi:transposase
MPKPYSFDLRERVVGFVETGHSRRVAAAHFRVSVSFVVSLMKAVRTRGSFEPKPSGGRCHAKLEPHGSFLSAQVVEKADITMPELAAALAATTGERADPASLSRWLIRAGYRFKKVCGPASKIAPTSSRRARNGPASANLRCGLSRTGWSSSTRPEPPPR